MVGSDVEKVSSDLCGMGDGCNGLAIAAYLVAMFVAGRASLEVDDPGLGGGIDYAVGA